MSEAYRIYWSFGGETPARRSHFHETALREARVASDHAAGAEPVAPARNSLLTRLRHAIAGPAAADACNCPA